MDRCHFPKLKKKSDHNGVPFPLCLVGRGRTGSGSPIAWEVASADNEHLYGLIREVAVIRCGGQGCPTNPFPLPSDSTPTPYSPNVLLCLQFLSHIFSNHAGFQCCLVCLNDTCYLYLTYHIQHLVIKDQDKSILR